LSNRTAALLFFSLSVCLIAATPAHAQDGKSTTSVVCGQSVPVSAPTCQKEFRDWQVREKRWRENRRVYGNYVTYKKVGVPHVKRATPPSWVLQYCQPSIPEHASEICDAYNDYLQYDWTQHYEGPQGAVTYVSRVSFGTGDTSGFIDYLLSNLHFDGGWINGFPNSSAYGLAGMHLTLAHASRIHLWGPPGMLVVRRVDGQLELKKTYGVDIFLGDVPIPFTKRKLPIYGTIAKVFNKTEAQAIQHHINAGIDMAGFSITLKR
jgi:hypothetical protein